MVSTLKSPLIDLFRIDRNHHLNLTNLTCHFCLFLDTPQNYDPLYESLLQNSMLRWVFKLDSTMTSSSTHNHFSLIEMSWRFHLIISNAFLFENICLTFHHQFPFYFQIEGGVMLVTSSICTKSSIGCFLPLSWKEKASEIKKGF